ncbi:hypothetical protein ACTXT7_015753 [Hymenolepis weldensis]
MLKAKMVLNLSTTSGFVNSLENVRELIRRNKGSSSKIEAKMSSNVFNTYTTTVSSNSLKNSTKYPVVLVSPNVLTTAIPVQAGDDDMKLHPPVRGSAKVANLTRSMKFSIPKVVPARLVSEPNMRIQQSVPKSCLLDHWKHYIFCPRGNKGGCYTFGLFGTYASSTMTKSPNCPGHCNHIRVKPKLIFRPKVHYLLSRSATVSLKPKTDPEEIHLDVCYFSPPWHSETPESSARSLFQTLQKTSKKIQGESNA